jgi:ABC-type antimicrobial peptide transport system permease subunit
LLLTSLLFRLALMQRAEEVGVLLAVGWQPRLVRRLIVREALTVAALGTLVGAV